MTSEVVAYVAVSIDGYIAGEGGSVDFLEQFGTDEYGFHEFFAGVDAVVMGSTTYEQILGFGWPYGDKPGLVLTTRDLDTTDGATITFSAAPTGDAIRGYARSYGGRVWVVGGGRVITDGISQGAIDILEMFVMPVVLGTGVPLFTGPVDETLVLTSSDTFSNGVVRLVYAISP